MVKKENSAENETKAPKRSALKRWTVRLALVVVIGGAGYGIWKNPQVLQQVKNAFRKEDVYQQQIEKINFRICQVLSLVLRRLRIKWRQLKL